MAPQSHAVLIELEYHLSPHTRFIKPPQAITQIATSGPGVTFLLTYPGGSASNVGGSLGDAMRIVQRYLARLKRDGIIAQAPPGPTRVHLARTKAWASMVADPNSYPTEVDPRTPPKRDGRDGDGPAGSVV